MPEVGRGLAYLLGSLETCSLGRAGSWQPSRLVPAEMAQQLWLWEQGLHVVYPSLLAFSTVHSRPKGFEMGRRWRRVDLAEKKVARKD